MALFELTPEGLAPVTQTTFTALGLRERFDIQAAVRKHIAAITPGIKTMVIAEEFGDWVGVNRRIDLLCIDEDARLVIVELKRDDSAHMELQALRYAAMVSTMRFDQAVDAHRKYLEHIGSSADAEQALREFLDVEDGPVVLSDSVRIVLASSEFSPEVTSTVLWLNKIGLDIRCVRMGPHDINGRIFVDVQQVIPLPAAEQYQVALREKTMEQAAVRSQQQRDMTRFDLTIGETVLANLPKRRLIFEVVREAFRRGVSPVAIAAAIPWRETIFVSAPGTLNEQQLIAAHSSKSLHRYYTDDADLFHSEGKTFAFSTQWGARTLAAVELIKAVVPAGTPIEYEPTSPVVEEASYGDYIVRRRESGSIEIEQGGSPCQPVKPFLRELAVKLGVQLDGPRGSELNTRQLGQKVMRAIDAL